MYSPLVGPFGPNAPKGAEIIRKYFTISSIKSTKFDNFIKCRINFKKIFLIVLHFIRNQSFSSLVGNC